ncbi:MAG: O-antigen ligase family protein [Rickettsiaceae bacterium]|nr:O-antigen ligase family protein [Rickettsiaceae bacterium]
MKKAYLSLIYLIPALGLLAGLSLGITIPVFIIINLYLIKDDLKVSITNYKLECAFFLMMFLSCFWAASPASSLISFTKTLLCFSAICILIAKRKYLLEKMNPQHNHYSVALLLAVVLFYVELISQGAINSWFRMNIQNKSSELFYLHNLDRGCSLLALFSWAVIAQLLSRHRFISAMLIYVLMMITLGVSDNLAGFLGFIAAGLVFVLTKYSCLRNPKFLSFVLGVAALLFIALSIKLNPYQISDDAKFLPLSAKHRLFIWDFTVEKAMEKPILGWGHGFSRQIDVAKSEMVIYEGQSLSPFPTHPHNNVLQILLENGFVGLALYIMLLCKYLFVWSKSFNNNDGRGNNIQAAGYAFFTTFFVISMISFNMWQSWWVCSFLWVSLLFSFIRSMDK